MPIFSYTFRDPSGGLQKGTADAESEEILRKRFEEQGFTITEMTMIKAKSPKAKTYGKVKLTHLSVFCRQFSTMVDAKLFRWFGAWTFWGTRRRTPSLRRS